MTVTIKTDRVSSEMLEMALLLSKHKGLSTQDLGQIKALCSPPIYPPELVAQNRIQKAKMSQRVFCWFSECSSIHRLKMGVPGFEQASRWRSRQIAATHTLSFTAFVDREKARKKCLLEKAPHPRAYVFLQPI
ncbi:hypothetical protein B9Z51_17490 [Limnohabitans sp. T6-5]|uniref:hypothetical protein n=1 Tax=Limnohabitans sp. T6-5 TaxID=1100724 RepID=UPI000D351501|nr:hypothetical protein [Limnohabitans sp. T6-5]PUE06034.1 hypothetical protein B9Z51_17490 [Limnohabitans sp. T6-5]